MQQQALNLLFEPGAHEEDGRYRFYLGNGRLNQGSYTYLHQLPIQNILGFWRTVEDTPRWVMDGQDQFLLNVPGMTVDVVDEESGEVVQVTCFVRFETTVHMEFWLDTNDDGVEVLMGRVVGHLLDEDIDRVVVQGIPFRAFFGGESPDLDLDGDGIFDAWTFDLLATGEAVVFNDDPPDGENRDPEPPFMNPAACEME